MTEPTFTLLGSDPDAATMLRELAARRAQAYRATGRIADDIPPLFALADRMQDYALAHPDDAFPVADAYPPTPAEQAEALQDSADQLLLTKLVTRFFRVMILGGVVIPETPAAMDWLRDYIDGTHKVHGPLGKPMVWPGRLPTVCQLLRDWGFQPTPTQPQYVAMRPGGVMSDIVLTPALSIPAAPTTAVPDRTGWWWARPHVTDDWEVVRVEAIGADRMQVERNGSQTTWRLEAFDWGPEVARPASLPAPKGDAA